MREEVCIALMTKNMERDRLRGRPTKKPAFRGREEKGRKEERGVKDD